MTCVRSFSRLPTCFRPLIMPHFVATHIITFVFRAMTTADRAFRLSLKFFQFAASIYLIFCLYHTGPHWILLVACLAVPVYGESFLFLAMPSEGYARGRYLRIP